MVAEHHSALSARLFASLVKATPSRLGIVHKWPLLSLAASVAAPEFFIFSFSFFISFLTLS